MSRDPRWSFDRLEDITLEEGRRAAAIEDESSVDGWGPLLHIQAWMDSAVTLVPLTYTWAAYAMNHMYFHWQNHGVVRLGSWVHYPYGQEF